MEFSHTIFFKNIYLLLLYLYICFNQMLWRSKNKRIDAVTRNTKKKWNVYQPHTGYTKQKKKTKWLNKINLLNELCVMRIHELYIFWLTLAFIFMFQFLSRLRSFRSFVFVLFIYVCFSDFFPVQPQSATLNATCNWQHATNMNYASTFFFSAHLIFRQSQCIFFIRISLSHQVHTCWLPKMMSNTIGA